jgi:multidrug efflux pump subunit AcrA (membrane-fusion protein)
MRIGRLILLAGCAGAVILGATLALPPRPGTVRVGAGPIGERIVARSVVVPSDGVRNVYASADGRVLRVFVREGDRVELGQKLAELERTGTPEGLLSPQAGVILGRHCDVGDFAVAADRGGPAPLFVIADADRTELRVEVEEADAGKLATKLDARITPVGADGVPRTGSVTRVSARLERRTIGSDDGRVRADGLIRVAAVSWHGEGPRWPLGTRAEVVLEVSRREAAARIPRGAIAVRDGRHVVEQPFAFWTREVPVEVVAVDDAYAEIRGLAPGAEVVIR